MIPVNLSNMSGWRTPHSLLMALALILSLVGAGLCEIAPAKDEIIPISSSQTTPTTFRAEPLKSALTSTTPTKKGFRTTKAYETTESPSTTERYSAKVHASTKGALKSTRRQKLNSSSSVARAPAKLQERLGAIDCDLAVLPRESRLWRGNETHELNLPVTECTTGAGVGGDEECPPVIVSWEGAADIQGGDILIVRIADSLLQDTVHHVKNLTAETNATRDNGDRDGRDDRASQPAVYQVTRQGHEHCDDSDGTLLDIAPLDERGAKLFTLYEKDLTEGVNLLIVVSETWKSQCVRLKVTVKSDNCGDSQDCSGKGVCYTNVSMEGYECQCCGGYVGPHCDERDSCNPSPCQNNGVCVDLTQAANSVNYTCVCPYGITGTNCEKDPCFSAPCLNSGTCMTMAMNGSTTFHCACADGWAGAQCELSVTGGACASNPCVKGICIEQDDSDAIGDEYRCFCQPGYTGNQCELEYNECISSPCANGGTCTDRVGGFTCVCSRGYTGITCQSKVDLCSPNPCPERRYCMDHGNTNSCECPRGYVGDECHIPTRSACDNNPCAHGGTCWSDIDSFYCSCRPGYTGKLCEEDFILEPVMSGSGMEAEGRGGGGSVRELHMPLGLYHDRLHNVYIAAGTLGAAIAIVGVVVTACHCRVNKTYSRLLSRLSRVTAPGPPHHWLQDKRVPPSSPFPPPSAALDTTDMYYTLDFSDSQSSPLIQ